MQGLEKGHSLWGIMSEEEEEDEASVEDAAGGGFGACSIDCQGNYGQAACGLGASNVHQLRR